MLLFKRKELFLVLALFFGITVDCRSQYNEVGILVGGANYKGELSPHLFNSDFIHFAGGVFYRHNWNRHWSYKVALNYGRISGDDALGETDYARNRNLSFFTDIFEFAPLIEFNFFPYETGNSEFPFTPYLFTGLTVFKFNPKAELGDEVYELQPLGTEGQGFNGVNVYGLTVIALPIGGGIKVSVGNFGFGLEVGARRTYTDYLDDVSTTYPDLFQLLSTRGPVAAALSDRSPFISDTSAFIPKYTGKQRGNPNDNDWYVFAGLNIYVRLNSTMKDSCSPFKRRKY